MKNIVKINLLLVSFIFTAGALISTSSHAMGKKRFNAIVASHKSHMKGLGENTKKYTYFQIDQLDSKVKRDKNSFLVVSGKNIFDSQTATKIDNYIKDEPQVTVITDFLNSDYKINDCLYPVGLCTHIKSCVVSNITGDIKDADIGRQQANTFKILRFINFNKAKLLYFDPSFCSSINESTTIDISSLAESTKTMIECFSKDALEANIKPIGNKFSLEIKLPVDPSNPFNLLTSKKRMLFSINFLSNELINSGLPNLQMIGQSLKDQLAALIPACPHTLDLDKIKLMTPKPLKDIKDMKDKDVPAGFKALYTKIKSKNSLDDLNFNLFFIPMLEYYFGVDVFSKPIWEIPEENQDEFKICIKHLLKAFNNLVSKKKVSEVASYLSVYLEGFEECPTRQVGELNQILAALGVRERQLNGLEGDIWNWVNDFKMVAYYDFLKDNPSESGESSHDYSEMWSAINSIVKLPTAIRKYKNKFFKFDNWQKDKVRDSFLLFYFTGAGIVEKIYKELTAKKSAYSAMDVRTLIANMEGTDTMTKFATHKKGYDAYFKPLAGKAAPKNFAWETSPITKGEVSRLLVLLRVFNK